MAHYSAGARAGGCPWLTLRSRQGRGEETAIGFARRAGEVFVDRTRSGETGFSPHFARYSSGVML